MNWMEILKIDDRPMTPDEFMQSDVPEGLEDYMNEHFDRRPGFKDRWFQIYLHANEGRQTLVNGLFGLRELHHAPNAIRRLVSSMKAVLRGSNEEMPGFPGVPVDDEHRPELQNPMNFIQNPNPQALDAVEYYEEE